MTWLDRLLREAPRLVARMALEGAAYCGDPTLEALCAGLPLEDAQALREERAGILEHQAALTRDEAERRAGLSRPPDPHDRGRGPPPGRPPTMCL